MLRGYFNDDNRKILLLRHGELDTGGRKIYVGQADVPLSGRGLRQANAWAHTLQEIPIGTIISSDLQRCAVTADIIGHSKNLPVVKLAEWREISFGLWDGRDYEVVKQEYPEMIANRYRDFMYVRPPEGENFVDLEQRVTAAFANLPVAKTESNILVVSHAGVMRTLLAHLMGLPPQNIFHIFQDFSCLNIIDLQDGQFKHVRALNLTN